MAKKIEMTDLRFGNLTVIGEAPPIRNDNRAYWYCYCDCGNTKIVCGKELRGGNVVTCAACNTYSDFDDTTAVCIVYNRKQFLFSKSDEQIVKAHVWSIDRNGYVSCHVRRKNVFLHRMLLNAPNNMEVDHINNNPSDRRRINLRLATRRENARNRLIGIANTSGYKGVSWHKLKKRWRAYISLNSKYHELGYFNNIKSAALAYNEAALRYYGKFANLNIIEKEGIYEKRNESLLQLVM